MKNIEVRKILNKITTTDMDNITFHQAFDIFFDIQNWEIKI